MVESMKREPHHLLGVGEVRTLLKDSVIARINELENKTKDFPYDIILQEFAKIDEPLDGIDGDLVDIAVEYYDFRAAKVKLDSEVRKILQGI